MSDEKIKIYQPKLLPVYPHPFEGDLAQICINKAWLPLLQGVLHPLRWKSAIWEGTPEEIALMHSYVEEILITMGDMEGCDDMGCDKISDLRIYQGKLQKKLCGSDVWENVGRVNPIVNYANNMMLLDLDGDDIVDVSFGPNPTDIPSEPEDPRQNDHICAGVNGLLDWMTAMYQSVLTETERMINGVVAVADTVFAIVTLGGGEITPIDNIIDFIQSISLALINTQRDQLADPEYQEEIRCSLYCLLKGSDGSLTEAVFNDWLDTIPDYPNVPGGAGWDGNIQEIFLFEAIQRRYNIYALNNDATCEELCTDCISYDWEHIFDFDAESGSPYVSIVNNSWAEWESGQGWKGVHIRLGPSDEQYALVCYIRLEFPIDTNIRELEVAYEIGDMSSNELYESAAGNIREEFEGSLIALPGSVTGSTNVPGSYALEWAGDHNCEVLVVHYYGGFKYYPTPPSGFIRFHSMTIRGNGTNPFA